ncbi:hypothetical protein ACFL2Y_03605 [Candidatus Omnitrophota bacterium]
MRIIKIILLSLFVVCAINSVSFAEDNKAKQLYLCVKGVVFDSERPLAIVNDKFIGEGQSLLGAKVVKISQKSVQFEYEGEIFNKDVGQDCLKIVSPSQEIIYLGGRRESLKDIVDKFIKLSTSKDARSKAELEALEKKLSNYFQQNIVLVVTLVLLLFILPYIYYAITLQMIATKAGTENPWLAWIPIANIYLECNIAGKPGWWVLIRLLSVFIPFVGPIITIIITIIVWMGISEARHKPAWIGIFSIIPPLSLFMWGYLAFSKEEDVTGEKKKEEEQGSIDIGQTQT